MTDKKRNYIIKIWVTLGLLGATALLAWFLLSEENMTLIRHILLQDYRGEVLQDNLQELGWRGYITVAVLSVLQVVAALGHFTEFHFRIFWERKELVCIS